MDILAQYFQELSKTGQVLLCLKVRPESPQNEILELLADGTIKVGIKAKAQEGRANLALIKYLAQTFKVPKRNVRIKSGATSHLKLVEIKQ